MLLVLRVPSTLRLFTVIPVGAVWALTKPRANVELVRFKVLSGAADEPAVFVTISVPPWTLIVLIAPLVPATIKLAAAEADAPLTLSVAVGSAPTQGTAG